MKSWGGSHYWDKSDKGGRGGVVGGGGSDQNFSYDLIYMKYSLITIAHDIVFRMRLQLLVYVRFVKWPATDKYTDQ